MSLGAINTVIPALLQKLWCLDVAFNEDQQRIRTGDAAANMALLSKLAPNLLKCETSRKVGIKIRRLEAGWNDTYLLKVLAAGGGGLDAITLAFRPFRKHKSQSLILHGHKRRATHPTRLGIHS